MNPPPPQDTASAETPAPFELRLRFRRSGWDRDVVVSGPFTATLGDVVREVGIGGSDAGLPARLERSGEVIPPATTIGASGLLHGDVLEVGAHDVGAGPGASGRSAAAPAMLRVVEGPDLGGAWPLAHGSHSIGREPDCAVVLSDPEVSRVHLHVNVDLHRITVEDTGSLNGSRIDGHRISGVVPVAKGTRIRLGATTIELAGFVLGESGGGTVAFNRPPRIASEPLPGPFLMGAPPDEPRGMRIPLAASLAPMVLGAALWYFTKNLSMLLFLALTPLIGLWSWYEDRRSGKRQYKKDMVRFNTDLDALCAKLNEARDLERARRSADAPGPGEIVRRCADRDPSLWERRLANDDFLALRLGTATLPSRVAVHAEDGGSEHARAEMARRISAGADITDAPALLELRDLSVVGLCGDRAGVRRLAGALLAQAVALHSPTDLVVAAAVSDQDVGAWDWLKWTPHARVADLLLNGPQLAAGSRSSAQLIERVVKMGEARGENQELGVFGRPDVRPWLLLVLDERAGVPRPVVARLLENPANGGVTVLWLGEESRSLPSACRGVVTVAHDGAHADLVDARVGQVTRNITLETFGDRALDSVGLSLAPLEDAEAAAAEGQIPRRLALLDLLGLVDSSDGEVSNRWSRARDLRAPIGVGESGVLVLDAEADGPHALVAGTTGAGKSELLRSIVAALALAVPPTRLNFLLVDYKGGSAFRECRDLPHCVGMVTDLNAELAQRALVSLNAELKRREQVLHDAGAKDLAELRRKQPERCPPSLMILIDEFATLAKEVPQFVDGVVGVAQLGRSLGVHLVLATQRPGGAVTPNIRANTNLRIALRVADPMESDDVIGTANAARIPRSLPGRALIKRGHGDLEEFQTAHVAGRSVAGTDEDHVTAHEFPFDPGIDLAVRKDGTVVETSDLTEVVRLTSRAAEALAIPPQRAPWLPALPEVLELSQMPAGDGDLVSVGLVDDPAHQRQMPLDVDLDRMGSLLVYGGPGSGKTSALRSIAAAACLKWPSDRLHLFALDFSTGGLRLLEAFPQCGAVVSQDESERVERLIRHLAAEVARRKHLFAQAGALDFVQFTRMDGDAQPLPRILVLLDDYAAFDSAYERVDGGALLEALPRLVADGRQLGVHFVITGNRRAAIPSTLMGIVPSRLVLDMGNRDDLGILGVDPKVVGDELPPGRCVVGGRLLAQVGLVDGEQGPEGQGRALAGLAARLAEQDSGASAPRISTLSTHIPMEDLPVSRRAFTARLGIGDSHLAPVELDLLEGHFLVVGPYRSGRSTALACIASGLAAAMPEARLHLFAPRRTSPLAELTLWTETALGAEACAEAAARLRTDVEARTAESEPLLVFIDNGEDLAEGPAALDLERIARLGRDGTVRLVGAVERQAARRAFQGWIPEVRKDEFGLLLDPDVDLDGDLLQVRLPRMRAAFPGGRGFLSRRGTAELVQVAIPSSR